MTEENSSIHEKHRQFQNSQEHRPCPDCGERVAIRDETRGELACANCGLVLDDNTIDAGPEWRAFTTEERDKRARTGSPINYALQDYDLSTMIDWRNRDAAGRQISSTRRAEIYRLRKWQRRSRVHSSIERNLASAMGELDRLSSQLGVSRTVKETAAVMYRRALERRLIRGRSIDAMIAAAMYAACRLREAPCTLDEIAHNSRINRKELGRCYRLLLRRLDVRMPVSQPTNFIPRFAQSLVLSSRVQRLAVKILEDARLKGITAGKDPTGLAASALYISAIMEGERRTQREIAEVAHVTEVTVRNRYKELVRELNLAVEF
ncbi:MAG: transcription initiation factor IIB [Promethearchaeota archaeon]